MGEDSEAAAGADEACWRGSEDVWTMFKIQNVFPAAVDGLARAASRVRRRLAAAAAGWLTRPRTWPALSDKVVSLSRAGWSCRSNRNFED